MLIWAGAGGGCVLALVNGVWLLAQGSAAGTVLGILSLLSGAGCVVFILLNRQRVEFSAHLLATVAGLTREFPGMVWVAVGAAGLLLLWMLVWSAAVSYTAQLPAQGSVLFLLLVSLIWTAQLLKAVVNATVAGTVASWYFLSPNVPRAPTARALKRALTTSFGSLCLGSLVAASLKSMRALARAVSTRSNGSLRACALCCLGFLDVLTRFFNELAYPQVAIYGKTFTRASRDTWTLLVHHSGVDALVQRELISTALTLSSVLAGLVCSLVCGVWAKAALGADHPQWWESVVAGFVIGFGSVSLVSVTVESGTNALFVCYAEDPAPLAAISTPLYSLFIQHPSSLGAADDHMGDTPMGGGGGGGGRTLGDEYEPVQGEYRAHEDGSGGGHEGGGGGGGGHEGGGGGKGDAGSDGIDGGYTPYPAEAVASAAPAFHPPGGAFHPPGGELRAVGPPPEEPRPPPADPMAAQLGIA